MTKLENLIKNLGKANQGLKKAGKTKPTRMNKDATIQRFEFTFELTWKTLQEYIRDQGFDCKSPKNCIRESARLGLIDNIEKWFKFLDNRNLIAHIYNKELANRVYLQAIKFPKEVEKILDKLQENFE